MDIKDLVKKVKQIEIRTRHKSQAALMGQYHSAFKGQGMVFSEIRPYEPGDEIRRIDWNKTARFKEPYVKVMQEERELTVMLMVDVSASMDFGTQGALKREYVAEICASVGFSAVGNNDKVGLILYADQVYKVIPPKKGRKHVLSILSQILSFEPVAAKSKTHQALAYLLKVFKKKAFVLILSDFQDDIEEKILGVAARSHSLLAFRVSDQSDMEIPNVGYLAFEDSETGQVRWVNTSSKRWRYDYAQNRLDKVKHFKEQLEKHSAGLIDLQTGAPYTTALHQYFLKR